MQMDMDSGEIYISDPRIYAAKQNDSDMPGLKLQYLHVLWYLL